jgi:predicted RNase H-like HicB family nuclease
LRRQFTLEYWRDGAWFVGRLIEVPSVFSRRTTLTELNENIQEVYKLMVSKERPPAPATAQRLPVDLEV